MKIKDLRDRMSTNLQLMVSQVNQGVTNSGAPYLSITFKDNTGTIEGKLWDVKASQIATAVVGRILDVRCDVINYRNNLQLKVLDIQPADEDTIDMEDYVQMGPVAQSVLRETIANAIESIDDFQLKAIVSAIFHKYDREIFSYPAAARNHHEYYGGLATHVYGMVRLADEVCKLYPQLNRDLLVSGVLLHDVGKIRELRSGAVTEYTVEGRLLGHISISQAMIKETADELGIEGEKVTLLRHLVLSHHGQYEFGSPVLPCILEAEALHYIDDFDARMTMIAKETDKINPGEFTPRLFALDNRAFYKPKGQ
ncbi:MAG: HD domain-containing protein [Erysipelotrichaceae bacterium]|nr:HD domain-containing protein [Erysipelotrichaceae bacterium]